MAVIDFKQSFFVAKLGDCMEFILVYWVVVNLVEKVNKKYKY